MSWSRAHYLTAGFLMMFVGLHFRIVESFVLTPQATSFIEEHSEGFDIGGDTYTTPDFANGSANPALFTPTYQQASSQNAPQWQSVGFGQKVEDALASRKTITPPTWLGWPMICAGAVLWLFGFTAPTT